MLRTASQRAVQMMAALAIVFAAMGVVAATSTQAHAYTSTKCVDVTTTTATIEYDSAYWGKATNFTVAASVSGETVPAGIEGNFVGDYNHVQLTGLAAGHTYDIKLTCGSYTTTAYSVKTVSGAPSSIKIDSQLTSTKKLAFAFKTGACDGYKITLDPYASGMANKTITESAYKYSPATISTQYYGMSLKTAYKAKVQTWVEDDLGVKHYSASKTVVLLPQPKASAKLVSKRSIKKGVKISWNKVSGAKYYTLYTSTKNGSYKKVGTYKGTSKVIKSVKGKAIKKGKNYYAYVVAKRGDYKSRKFTCTQFRIY